MMKIRRFKKVGFFWLLFLLLYCSSFIFTIVFLIQLIVSLIFYFHDGQFLFLWTQTLVIALEKGGIAGTVLGLGIWIKGKLEELKKHHLDIK